MVAGAEVLVQQPAKTFPNRLSINAMVKQYQLGQVDTWSWCWWWNNHLVAGAQMLVQAASHLLVLVQLFGGWWLVLPFGGWCSGAWCSQQVICWFDQQKVSGTNPPPSLFRTRPFRNSSWLHCLSNSDLITGSNAFLSCND